MLMSRRVLPPPTQAGEGWGGRPLVPSLRDGVLPRKRGRESA
jgi:hypothetical protein